MRVKLSIFASEIVERNKVAGNYYAGLGDVESLVLPRIIPDCTSVWAQFVVRLPAEQRDGVSQSLKNKGVATAIYYPKPLHWQSAYQHFPIGARGLKISEELSQQVLALPMHPYLSVEDQDYVCKELKAALV